MRQTRKPQLALGGPGSNKLDRSAIDGTPWSPRFARGARDALLAVGGENFAGHQSQRGTSGDGTGSVMGVLKQGHRPMSVNQPPNGARFLGHGAFSQDDTYELQTILTMCICCPRASVRIGQLVVESERSQEKSLASRCAGAVIRLWSSRRALPDRCQPAVGRDAVLAPGVGPSGEEAQRRRLAPVATSHPRGEEVFQQGPLDATREEPTGPSRSLSRTLLSLVDRAEESLKKLEQAGVAQSSMIQSLIAHARRQIDQVERRLLKGETIAHDEKVFSIFEEHTRWVSKGKALCSRSSKTNSSSSFTTRFCGKGAIPILRCRSSTRRRHCIATYGCAASTVGSTAPATGGNRRKPLDLNAAAAQGSAFSGRARARGSASIGQAPAPGGRVGNLAS